MRASRLCLGFLSVTLVPASLSGCGIVLGLDEFQDEPGAEGSTTSGVGGGGAGGLGGGGTGGQGGGGGLPGCTPGEVMTCPYSGPPSTDGIGPCIAGTKVCSRDGSGFGACAGEVLAAASDDCATAEDENCDGQSNEGCPCAPGSSATCYGGPRGTSGVGVCHAGTQICNADGMGYGNCEDEVKPGGESCDPGKLDEDCDGAVNEEGVGCVCLPGVQGPCYTGPLGTLAVGICMGGTHACADDGLGYTACAGEITPQAETCASTIDENCDGADCALWDDIVGDSTDQGALSVAVDGVGNVYSAGFFTGSLSVGNLPPLVASGGNDAFLVKYDPTGTAVWSQKYGLSSDQVASDVAVDASGDVLLTGYFTGSMTIGAITHTTLANEYRAFVAKIDPAGGALWSTTFVTGTTSAVAVAVDPIPLAQGGGNVVLAGTSLNGAETNAFLRRYTASGALTMTKAFGDGANQVAEDVAVDSAGNILLVGAFKGGISFGVATLTSAGLLDLFLAKLDSNGSEAWSKRFGDAASDQYGNGVAVAATGEVTMGGAFYGTIDLGGGTKTSAGNADILVAQFSSGGAHLWSKTFGDTALQSCRRVAIDANKNVLISGWILGKADFGGGPLTSAGVEDIFVLKLDSGGTHVWSRAFGDAATQLGHGLAAAPGGEIVVAGWSKGSVDFGLGNLASAGAYDAIVAELAP